VLGKTNFEAEGLIVAERDGLLVGFVHAGFGPDQPETPPLSRSVAMGTVCMLVLAPGLDDPEVESRLLLEAEKFLLSRGASVLYAGGQSPLNPHYWGVYGGSEWAGILEMDAPFHRAVLQAGYHPVSTCVLLDLELASLDIRDARGVLIRRQTQLEVVEDALPETWWDALAIGDFHPTRYRLLAKSNGNELARATTWDMGWFSRLDGLPRIGLIEMEVHPDFRRRGYGRHLVNEILRSLRTQGIALVSIQTRSTNAAALALYESIGFRPVDSATLYRLPGGISPRGAGSE
jgi:ribosomal protein S18 acetylase RimI-like enzyme